MFDIVSFLLGVLACGVMLGGIFAVWAVRVLSDRATLRAQLDGAQTATAQMTRTFEGAAAKVVQNAQEQLLLLAREKLQDAHKDAAHEFDKRQKAVADLVAPVNQTMEEIRKKLHGVDQMGAGLTAQLQSFADDQRALRAQTAMLAGALKNSSARGQWGEMQLKRTLEIVGLVEGQHYHQQKNITAGDQNQRPDIIIDLPGKLNIVIDAKVPLDPSWQEQAVAETAPPEQDMKVFKAALRSRVKELGSKEYWRQFDSPEFVVMFLPTESLFSLAIATDKTLVEDAAAQNVIIASPTTILGLLRLVGFAWQQQKLAENARSIGALAQELQGRMDIFVGYLLTARKNLIQAMGGYDKAVSSLNTRVMPQLRKMAQARGKGDDDHVDVPMIEADEVLLAVDDKAA
jgi:DNA recombination protein RmuC